MFASSARGGPQPLLRRRLKRLRLGSREIHIKAVDGTIFKAPDLVYHYVKEHGYCPPEAFIRAITDGKCERDAKADQQFSAVT